MQNDVIHIENLTIPELLGLIKDELDQMEAGSSSEFISYIVAEIYRRTNDSGEFKISFVVDKD